jgi:transcriptional regulator with XRE-family HTH domain
MPTGLTLAGETTRTERQRGMATAVQDPTVQRRRLRMELRRARDSANLKQADVAKAMDWSPSKLIRIENGQVGISTNDLKALLGHYGVKEKRRVDSLLELSRASRGQSWYDPYNDMLTAGFREYLAYETAATTIRQYEPLLVTGLLQTEEYARAILHAFGVGEEGEEKLWAVRQHRQELHDRDDPPELLIILDEAAIRRWVGGPGVMRKQLERLKEAAGQRHVTIQILPFTLGPHPGLAGPFIVLQFDDPFLDDIVFLESAGDATIRDDTEVTARYLDRFADLEDLALTPEQSLVLIDDAIVALSASAAQPAKQAS